MREELGSRMRGKHGEEFKGSQSANPRSTEELRMRSILLANSQGALEASVAEVGVSLVLDCLRKVRLEADKVRRGQWVRAENLFRYE